MLPATYRKVVATTLSRNFRAATEVIEAALPAPQPGEVVIRNLFAGVNASDVNITAGVYFASPTLPFDTGVEATGEIVALGDDVTHLRIGDHVLTVGIGGGYREYQVANATTVIPIPQASAELTAVSVGALSASMALEIGGGMGNGETVLITAAAGGVGHFAVQLAKQAGNHVIGVCSTAEKAALLRELGCDRVIAYREADLDAVLRAEYPNGIDLVLEGAGGPLFDTCVQHLAKRGRLVTIGFISEYGSGPQSITAPRLYHTLLWKSATVRGFLFSDYADHIPAHMGRMMQMLGEGTLHSAVDPTEFRGVDAVVDAVEHLQAGRNTGKVIVRF
jgi:NADPH-dependent curcumin reductase CurA